MAPKKQKPPARPALKLTGLTNKSRRFLIQRRGTEIRPEDLNRIPLVDHQALHQGNNNPNFDPEMKKKDLLLETLRLLYFTGHAKEQDEDAEEVAEEVDEDFPAGGPVVRPCCVCKAKVPAYIFDVCKCLGICGRCRAARLWGSGDRIPPSAREILDGLRTQCPRAGCGQWTFGRQIVKVHFIA